MYRPYIVIQIAYGPYMMSFTVYRPYITLVLTTCVYRSGCGQRSRRRRAPSRSLVNPTTPHTRLQGYLARKSLPLSRTLQWGSAWGLMRFLGGGGTLEELGKPSHPQLSTLEREFVIDNLLVRIHLIIRSLSK